MPRPVPRLIVTCEESEHSCLYRDEAGDGVMLLPGHGDIAFVPLAEGASAPAPVNENSLLLAAWPDKVHVA